MNNPISFLLFYLACVCASYGQELPIPDGYSVVDSVTGDLDNDFIAERVVAFNIGPENEYEGVPRELIIYKRKNHQWTIWRRSSQALLGSQDGGMMGDPFGELEIKNGILLISQNGGSSWKWGFTDKYRFQDDEFYLIGYSSIFGKPCEYWEDVDFNISTGMFIVKKEFEACERQQLYKKENETFFEKGLKITLQNRQVREIKIISPKYGHEIYLAIGME